MYSKIAVSNVKKSFKDYAIYFLTLTLAVCIFYSFNSIESQKALTELKYTGSSYIKTLTSALAGISVFVSIILGSLILYASNFLIKKRKKELGIYMTLGMGKRRISSILVTETIIVGVISLISGLILGIAASQALSGLTLKLFDLPMNEYKFAVSIGAIGKTILYFGIMFLLVIIFNVFVISKYKIIDLLTASKKNEEVKFKNPIIYLIVFVLCVISLGYAYKTILKIGFNIDDPMLLLTIILGILGTVLFFFSLSGFILYIVKKNKKVYLKELNIFIIKQINSKVNTNFLSMSLICLMLFLTIGILSTGISFKQATEEGLKQVTPFDASVRLYNDGQNNHEDTLNKIKSKISKNEKYIVYNEYDAALSVGELLKSRDKKLQPFNVSFVKVSDYNKILQLKGEKEINLNKDEVLISSDKSPIVQPFNKKLKDSNKLNIKGKEYLVKNTKVIEENLHTTSGFTDNVCTIIINDEFLSGYKIRMSVFNVNYLDKNREEYNKKYDKIADDFFTAGYRDRGIPLGVSKDQTYSESKASTVMVLYIGIYIGIVFLITSMAVLALQQLSEASDSIERYKALKRIGANERMINKTIFMQTCIYFSLPVILALIHSVVGIKMMSDMISNVYKLDITLPALMTAFILIIVYVGYFFTTYIGYKNIVKSNL
ncbi:ABC transporter permease [Bacillus hominis]|uniref:ABC transporter permease n=1 Tax=Bacillus hominis TaxID=2817478 RepID=A0ABT7RGF2_9BACI|nr:ABC transporter permease [Bacillus hominis]MDM5191215.1 ABC transporter permease [Bacillus hominis]MDM5436447.1 ABC transporter permease [Bacillus hominis]MDM5441614.1 ABC transporter permease [Bacillus hominis]